MPVGTTNALAQVPLKHILALAVETWRIKRKLTRLRDASGTDEVAGLLVSTERMDACFQQMGVECRDYDGQLYDEGLNVTVLDYEEKEELPDGAALITQTVAPGVMVQGGLIRQGEVVVARGIGKQQEEADA